MHAGHRGHGARGAEQVRRCRDEALAQPVLGLERLPACSTTWRDHGIEHVAVDELAAEALGQRDHADRQRRPGGDASLHLQALRQRAAPRCLRRPRSSQISSEEPPPMSNTSAKSQAKSISEAQPETASLASVSRSTICDVEAGLARARAPGTRPRWRRARQASVAIRPARTTRCRLDLAGAHLAAPRWCARWRLPTAGRSPIRPRRGRMMRENASMTLKPRRDGRRHQQPAIVGAGDRERHRPV